VARAGLGIRTSADIFDASEEYEQIKSERASQRRQTERSKNVASSRNHGEAGVRNRNLDRTNGGRRVQGGRKSGLKRMSRVIAGAFWSEAITKLDRLMLRRHQTPGQRVIEDCASPVSQIDLERLATARQGTKTSISPLNTKHLQGELTDVVIDVLHKRRDPNRQGDELSKTPASRVANIHPGHNRPQGRDIPTYHPGSAGK